MHDAIERFQIGLLIAFLLTASTMFFLDRAQLKRRRTIGPIIWIGPAVAASYYLWWAAFIVLSLVRDVVDHPAAHTHAPISLAEKIAIAAIFGFVLLFLAAAIRFKMRLRVLGNFQLSRGKLLVAVRKLSKNSKFLGIQDAPLFVIPDLDFAEMSARMGSGVVLPLSLLDSLTRREIDALAARQLCVQSKQFYFPIFWILLACNVAVVAVVQGLEIPPLYAFLLYLSLLVLEFLALSRKLPQMFFRADLRAIHLTGNAEAFFSGLGSLSRFTGVPADKATLWEIGRKVSVSPDRIETLLAEHDTKAEDRYPTSGSYMETGL
jgi:hypothetical protein